MDNEKRIQKTIKEKNARIDKFVDSKQNSIKQSSIMRDAALFTSARLGTFKEASQKDFIEEYKYWRAFFEKEYNANEKVVAHEEAKKDYKLDPTNTLDVTPEEAGSIISE